MTREEALAKADQIVTGWIADPPKNGRGYVADGWKAPSLAERTEAVEQLAAFLMKPGPVSNLVPPVSRSTLFGWPIDGQGELPTEQQYRMAKHVLASWLDAPEQPRLAAEVEAVHALIGAYEDAQKAP